VAGTLGLSQPVHRVLARDDLLRLAEDAQHAVGIVRESERLARKVTADADLFAVALEYHLGRAGQSPRFAIKIQALDYAATIVRFCDVLGLPLDAAPDATVLHERALRTVSGTGQIGAGPMSGRDMTLEVLLTYRAIRNYRLTGDYDAAIKLAARPPRALFATGGQPIYGDYQYETGASLLMRGLSGQVNRALAEAGEEYWATTEGGDMTRHRRDLILALAAAQQGGGGTAVRYLHAARDHLAHTRRQQEPGVQDLSVTLALAEQLARREQLAPGKRAQARADEAVALASEALTIADGIRSRWKVIARARTPLAIVFRRVYGDIALLAAGLPGHAAAELGFRVALSAKQTGFATRMREGSLIGSNRVLRLIERIVAAEDRRPTIATGPSTQQAELDVLWEELKDTLSPLLADTVLPSPANAAEVRERIGPRHALDFVALPDTSSRDAVRRPGTFRHDLNWFHTYIEPGGTIRFERFTPGPHFLSFFAESREEPAWLDRLTDSGDDGPDWLGLARELLPRRLLSRLRASTPETPVELLISAHSVLSLMPWPALKIDADGTRLIERAIVAQVPVFTCLSDEPQVPTVTGAAVVRLVAGVGETRLNVDRERAAWQLPAGPGGVPLSRCVIGPDPSPAALDGTLAGELCDHAGEYGFAHVASHGGGFGLDQELNLPERLTAAEALTMHWPESVLMASCHVGRLFNVEDDEPLSFVMALLTGGSRCVAAAIDQVPDLSTGRLAADMVTMIRAGGTRLDVALRQAQLQRLGWGWPEATWALFSAYVR
jgi:CHAT domain-containing protein